MNTRENEPPHESETESTVVRFDEKAKKSARPVVPLSRASSLNARGKGRGSSSRPRGLFLALGVVIAAAALAGGLYHENRQDNSTPEVARAVEDSPAAPQAVVEAAATAATDVEAAPEVATEAAGSAESHGEQAALPQRPRTHRSRSVGYAARSFYADDDDDADERLEKAREEADKRAERARKEAEKRSEQAREEAEERAERRREREKDRDRKPRLVGVYTVRSKH